MTFRRALTVGVELVLVAVAVSLLAGTLLGYPVGLGYVETGSMEPTLQPGDGFVAVPAAVAGPVEEGDVVVFRAEEIQGGGLTTHRVVEETDRGYVTRGDANPFTDQDGDEPPVKDAQVVAVAWQPGGTVLAIPGLGAVVTGIGAVLTAVQRRIAALAGTRSLLGAQGVAYVVLALSAAAYVADLLVADGSRDRGRDRSRTDGTSARLVVAGLAGLVVLAATAAMVAPAGPQEFGVVSAEFDSERPTVIPAGERAELPYTVGNGAFVPVVAYVEPGSEGVAVAPRERVVGPRATANATLTLSAPPETGYYRRYVVEHRYLYVLPLPVIRALYGVHPWLPVVVVDALLGGAFYGAGVALVGRGRVRRYDREGPSVLERVARRFG